MRCHHQGDFKLSPVCALSLGCYCCPNLDCRTRGTHLNVFAHTHRGHKKTLSDSRAHRTVALAVLWALGFLWGT